MLSEVCRISKKQFWKNKLMNKTKIAVYTFIGLVVLVSLAGVVIFLHIGVPFPH